MRLRYPCIEGWDSQGYSNAHKGLDFGWCKAKGNGHTEIQACADGVVEFEGFYQQRFTSGVYNPIGVIIRHPQFSDAYDYISIYWHLASTCVDKGQKISEGQKIGIKGNTGFSGGIHLHFQLLKIAKGAPVPDQHKPYIADNWAKVSVNPVGLLYVHPSQYFQYTGNFDLPRVEEDTEATVPQAKYDAIVEALKKSTADFNALEERYKIVTADFDKAKGKLSKISEVLGDV